MLNDASIDQVLAFDTNMQVISWNRTCEQLTGISKEEIVGKHLLEVFPEIAANEEVMKAINNALKGFKTFVPANKGSYRGGYFESHFIPLKDDQDEVFGVMNIKHDVSHRVKVENELKQLNKALARKNKELKQKNADLVSFTHVAGHDLKEPLRKIYTFVEMILTEDGRRLSEKSRGYFKRIQSAAQRMGLLTDDILAFGQISETEGPTTDVDLNQVLEHAKLQLSELIANKQAVIDAGELPVVKGYCGLLKQVMAHMLTNAIKFQHDGNIPHIAVSCGLVKGNEIKHTEASPDVTYARISFADNGIGFDKKYTPKIFQVFQRLHDSNKYPGTGIGLAFCKKIVELHNGFITVESEPGNGSTFHCFLPDGELTV
ncbi:MAG: domain S-box protein [Flavipsychrobacter sp.]|nr:domain S-box protein [Flavipsychrobacter sp.]